MHDPANRVRLSLNQQVNVISHQAVSIKEEWEFALLNRQQREKLFRVCRRIEYLATIIAASNDVIEPTCNLRARSPSHGARMLLPVDFAVNATDLHQHFDR